MRGLLGYEPREYLQGRTSGWSGSIPRTFAAGPGRVPAPVRARPPLCEYRFRHKDGAYRWVSDEQRLVRDEAGEPLEVVGSWSDITERKRAEAALRERTALLGLLQAVAVAANEAATVEEAMRFCLERVCAHTGWPVGHVYALAGDGTGELVPTAVWHLADPERYAPFRAATEAARFAPGVGLPGRVVASGKPAWIIDVTRIPTSRARRPRPRPGSRPASPFPCWSGARSWPCSSSSRARRSSRTGRCSS